MRGRRGRRGRRRGGREGRRRRRRRRRRRKVCPRIDVCREGDSDSPIWLSFAVSVSPLGLYPPAYGVPGHVIVVACTCDVIDILSVTLIMSYV
eukprot:5325200-Pyramimonas_sp.AAC.1